MVWQFLICQKLGNLGEFRGDTFCQLHVYQVDIKKTYNQWQKRGDELILGNGQIQLRWNSHFE
jgi:hypothetical protein